MPNVNQRDVENFYATVMCYYFGYSSVDYYRKKYVEGKPLDESWTIVASEVIHTILQGQAEEMSRRLQEANKSEDLNWLTDSYNS